MANIQINIIENGTTTLATSGCICDRNIDINVDVPSTGGGGYEIPEDKFIIRGGTERYFYNDNWTWFINLHGDKITTENILNCGSMFQACSSLEAIPFDLNFRPASGGASTTLSMMFMQCFKLKEIGDLNNIYPKSLDNFFAYCRHLRYLPKFNNPDFSSLNNDTYTSYKSMFNQCYSLREVPESLLKQLYTANNTSYNVIFGDLFNSCYALDEVRGLSPRTNNAVISNMFTGAFTNCYRIKDIIFDVQEDGTPYSVNWGSQIIDLSKNIGYAYNTTNITGNNSGITADKEVKDDATYATLKNDPDWFTVNVAYSRYNHDSAVNTINSLPDASAGSNNIIKFNGASGSATDGGAISNLTEDEIAVATAKGWTVQIV